MLMAHAELPPHDAPACADARVGMNRRDPPAGCSKGFAAFAEDGPAPRSS
jgi:hypothetical protein